MTGASFRVHRSNGITSRSIASGQLIGSDGDDGGMAAITRRFGDPTPSASSASDDGFPDHSRASNASLESFPDERKRNGRDSYLPTNKSVFDLGGIRRRPFMGIVALSYSCLLLALLNIFEESEPGNPFNVPYQILPSVRVAQYLALIIALIMEEEIPTGLYLLRMISKESLHLKYPKLQFWRFVLSAIVRLIMGCKLVFDMTSRPALFLLISVACSSSRLVPLYTFCVCAQATAVLDM
ncbi:hypothetical protein ACHAXT_008539 [Thalassiosira profunda]